MSVDDFAAPVLNQNAANVTQVEGAGGVSILVTPVFVHKKEFLFLNFLKGFWISLAEISQFQQFLQL
jgi:hypothetical protein